MVQWLSEDVVLHVLQGASELREAQARLVKLETEARRPAGGAAGGGSGSWGGPAAARGAAAALRQRGIPVGKVRPPRCGTCVLPAMGCRLSLQPVEQSPCNT
jgi:hypothetical protein